MLVDHAVVSTVVKGSQFLEVFQTQSYSQGRTNFSFAVLKIDEGKSPSSLLCAWVDKKMFLHVPFLSVCADVRKP